MNEIDFSAIEAMLFVLISLSILPRAVHIYPSEARSLQVIACLRLYGLS